ncbi:MAG: hypothetical protein IAF08_05465 [Rhizobacter sp.]|nr:hypothetical protein [Chlorobiales bacterium]
MDASELQSASRTESPRIEFRKTRNLGDIINITLLFMRQNFKPLATAIVYIAGPFALLTGVAAGIYQANVRDLAIGAGGGSADPFAAFSQLFSVEYFLIILFSVLESTALIAIVYTYINLYIDRPDTEPQVQDIWQGVQQHFLKVFSASLLAGLLLILGIVLLVIPGIYISVPISFIYVIMLRENRSVGEAISRGFALVRGHWWQSLGVLVVVGLLGYIVSFVFSLPAGVIGFVSAFNSVREGSGTGATLFERALYVLTSIISSFGTLIFYGIVYIATAFQYFNLAERKEATGLMNKLQGIDTPPAPNTF